MSANDRVRAHPILTLMAVVSAILILVGRINRTTGWGDPVFIAGIVLLVLAGALFFVSEGRRPSS